MLAYLEEEGARVGSKKFRKNEFPASVVHVYKKGAEREKLEN